MNVQIFSFFLLMLSSYSYASQPLFTDSSNPIKLSILNVGQVNSDYTIGMLVKNLIPEGSYFLVTFPFSPGSPPVGGCKITATPNTDGVGFDPSTAFEPGAISTPVSIVNCQASGTVVSASISSTIPANTFISLIITATASFTAANPVQTLSVEIASTNDPSASNRYTYAINNNLATIVYKPAPLDFGGTKSAALENRNKYDNAIDPSLPTIALPFDSLYDSAQIAKYSGTVPYQVISNKRAYYASMYPNDADFAREVAPLVIPVTTTACGFNGTLGLTFAIGATATPSMCILDVLIPDGWITSLNTKCYFASDNGATTVTQTACKLIGNYIYLIIRQPIPSNTQLSLKITQIQNPEGIVASTPVRVRIVDFYDNSIIYSSMITGLATAAASLTSLNVIQSNTLLTDIFANELQYLAFQIASPYPISTNSAIVLKTTATSGGFKIGTCRVNPMLKSNPSNTNPIACLVTDKSTVQIKNFASFDATAVFEFSVLIMTEGSPQTFTAEVHALDTSGNLQPSASLSISQAVTYVTAAFTFKVMMGSDCATALAPSDDPVDLCFISTDLTSVASSTLTIKTHSLVFPGTTPITCKTSTNVPASSCAFTSGDFGYFFGASSAVPVSTITIASAGSDGGVFKVSTVDISSFASTNLNVMMLEFFATYNGGHAYTRVDLQPTADTTNSIQVMNAGTDSDISAFILLLRLIPMNLQTVPIPLDVVPRISIYFNPAKFTFPDFADYLGGSFLGYPCSSTTNLITCVLLKGDSSGPDFTTWHKVIVTSGLILNDEPQVYIPMDKVSLADGDIHVGLSVYEPTANVEFPYGWIEVQSTGSTGSLTTITASLEVDPSSSFPNSLISTEINYDSSTLTPLNDDAPNDLCSFIIFASWNMQDLENPPTSTDADYVVFIDYTKTLNDKAVRSILILGQGDLSGTGTTGIDNLKLSSSFTLPAYRIYETANDGSAIAKSLVSAQDLGSSNN